MLFLLFPLLGLLGRCSCFPWAVYLSDLLTEFFIEKPCNTASHYKSYGIFSTLFSSTADHTIPVLDMAAAAAVPSGILIWFLGSMAYAGPETGYGALLYSDIAGGNLLAAIIHFLEHPARLLGPVSYTHLPEYSTAQNAPADRLLFKIQLTRYYTSFPADVKHFLA